MDSVIDGVFDPVEMLALEVCNDSFHVVAWTASQGSVPSCWPAMPALVSLGGGIVESGTKSLCLHYVDALRKALHFL